MNCLAKFTRLNVKSNNWKYSYKQTSCLFSYERLKLSKRQTTRDFTCLAGLKCPVWGQTAVCLNSQFQRYKSSKRKGKKASDSDESDESDDDDEEGGDDEGDDDDESLSDIEPDYDEPLDFKHSMANSLRANNIIAVGLSMSTREAERMFYESKFLFRGKTLLKKGRKLNVGDYIDVVCGDRINKLSVQRVRVIKVFKKKTAKNKPVIAIRVWKKPFEIDKPKDYVETKPDS